MGELDLDPEQVGRAITEVGLGFMFAPAHHSAMRYAVGPRRDLGMRTLFNILGPMTNPAGVKRQVIGVFSGELCEPMTRVLQILFFALIANDTLYLKVDDSNRSFFLEAGCEPFRPFDDERTMNYYDVPVDVVEDPDALAVWSGRSIDIARQAPRRKKKRGRSE